MLQGLIIANADPSVFWLNNLYVFIYLLLRFAYSGVLFMTAFLKINPIPKISNIPIYRLAYSIAMYRNISYHNPCIVMRIVSPDSCQNTALLLRADHLLKRTIRVLASFKDTPGEKYEKAMTAQALGHFASVTLESNAKLTQINAKQFLQSLIYNLEKRLSFEGEMLHERFNAS